MPCSTESFEAITQNKIPIFEKP